MILEFTVEEKHQNNTLNVYLRSKKISAALIRKLKFYPDSILVDEKKQNVDYKISTGEKIKVNVYDSKQELAQSHILPQDIPIDIVYIDECCMVVDKPFDMAIHPSLNHQTGTLANAFCGYWKSKGQEKIYRVINRLDKNTSGLVLIALDAYSAENLKTDTQKIYTAIVQGEVTPKQGIIEKPIARTDGSIITRCVSSCGQYSKTEYKVIKQNKDCSLLDIILHTGRTHQIRVHFSHIGHPLLGDDMYGGKTDIISRQALHCRQISFLSPINGKKITIKSNIPPDMEAIVSKI